MLMEAMATHELLAKNFFEVHLRKMAMLPSQIHQNLGQIVVNDSKLICYVTYSLFMRYPIWTSILFNKTLIFANYYNIVMLFSAMVEKCLRTLIFYLLFCFITSFGVISLPKGFLLTSSLKPLLNFV